MNPGDGEVVRFWAPWTSTPGFPLVTVSVTDAKMTLKQKRFMRTGITHDKTEVYNIPITYVIDSENYDSTTPKFVFRMEDGSAEKTFDLEKKPTKYIILNTKQTGYYRVNYDENNWNQIKEALRKDNFDGIHVMNRAQIVDDLFNLARAGIVKYSSAVDIIRYIKKEKHYIPWLSAISHGLTFLSQRVSGQKNQEVFSWFILDTLDEVYKHLKFDAQVNDRRTDIYNRVNILTWACRYGHQECIKSSKALFESFMKGTSKVPKNHRSTVYCNAVRHGNGTEFNFLYDRYMDQDISAEQLNFLIGMGCTKDAALVKVGIFYIFCLKLMIKAYFIVFRNTWIVSLMAIKSAHKIEVQLLTTFSIPTTKDPISSSNMSQKTTLNGEQRMKHSFYFLSISN